MSKQSFQDITPPPRRSIRDVALPEKKRLATTQTKDVKSVEHPHPYQHVDTEGGEEEIGHERRPERVEAIVEENTEEDEPQSPRLLVGSVIVVALIAVFFVASTFFAGAEVTVTQKVNNLPVSLIATSTKDGSNATLPYDVIILNREESSAELAATSSTSSNTYQSTHSPQTKSVAVAAQPAAKASGTITVVNNYSADPQTLIATTRFQTAEGLVYRIDNDITVPGETTVNGKTVAGSISAMVHADQTGSTYNISPTTFTIPGLQGTAKYSAFTGQSRSSMTGGSSGTLGSSALVSSATLSHNPQSQLKSALDTQIQSDLIKEAEAQMPDNYVLYPTSSIFSFQKASSTSDFVAHATSSEIREQGTAYFVIFDKDSLSRFLQAQIVATSASSSHIQNINAVSVSLVNASSQDIIQNNPLVVSIIGSIPISWNVNPSSLANDLQGKSKLALQTVLKNYPQVASAQASIRPFWKSSFPNDSSNIKITLKK